MMSTLSLCATAKQKSFGQPLKTTYAAVTGKRLVGKTNYAKITFRSSRAAAEVD